MRPVLKKEFILREIIKLNKYHKLNSKIYSDIIQHKNKNKITKIDEIPFLPTRLFKHINFKNNK